MSHITPASMPQHIEPSPLVTVSREVTSTQQHSILCTCRAHGKRKHYGKPMLATVPVVKIVTTYHEPLVTATEPEVPQYGQCMGCGSIEVRLNNVVGIRDLSAIGESSAYPVGTSCELCD